MSMGVLSDYLCICDHSELETIDVWAMKDYGVQRSWIDMFSIESHCDDRWFIGLYQVLKCYDFMGIWSPSVG